MLTRFLRFRRPVIVVCHIVLMVLANWLAFSLRFDGAVPDHAWRVFVLGLPWLLVARAVAFFCFRLYEGLWRYTGVWDLRNLVLATGLSSTVFFLINELVLHLPGYPHSVYAIDAVLLMFFVGGMRLVARAYRVTSAGPGARRVLIYGAGDAGAMIAHEMMNRPHYAAVPVGFVDDDRSKHGYSIHGLRVLGSRDDLAHIVERTAPDEVLIALPQAPAGTVREVVATLEPFNLSIKTLPNLSTLLNRPVHVADIRPLALEDLLDRSPIGLDAGEVQEFIRGRRVLVTGAGGSIGSELCRQIVGFAPAVLVMLDRYENGLFGVQHDVTRSAPAVEALAVIGDVTDQGRLNEVFSRYQPEIVFHAAAHKHVPLMEWNPCEAVKNNVGGTRLLAGTAARYGVGHFILISTDKAVNPTNVMGATKRVAELIIRSLFVDSGTIFAAVRFGNVLGSNGSVVPLFTQQIAAGGPVTVTHPDVRRFFMLIPEAVQLVLHAASLARGGEVFVLDMGGQIKLVDMAHNLIRLAGLRPGTDVPIEFIGMRPGEKMEEELVGTDEVAEPSGRDKIMRVRSSATIDRQRVATLVSELERTASSGKQGTTIAALRAVVPNFTPLDGVNQPGGTMAQGNGRHSSVPADAPAPEPYREPNSGTLVPSPLVMSASGPQDRS